MRREVVYGELEYRLHGPLLKGYKRRESFDLRPLDKKPASRSAEFRHRVGPELIHCAHHARAFQVQGGWRATHERQEHESRGTGTASVELVAAVPFLLLALAVAAQIALAGQALWSASVAARPGAGGTGRCRPQGGGTAGAAP